MNFFLLILTIFLAGCISCESKKDTRYKSRLDHDYDFVLGLAVPDSDRLYPTEVFVGRLLDDPPPGDSLVDGHIANPFLAVQVRRYQNTYISAMKYHNDAMVTISTLNQTIQLQNVGEGTYRDVNNELHIESLGTYHLEVRRPNNKIYSADVKVPGRIFTTNISNNDTVSVYPKKGSRLDAICYTYAYVVTNSVEGCLLYRIKTDNDGPADGPVHYASFKNYDQAGVVILNENSPSQYINFEWEVLAFDTLFSRFYQREGLGANDDVFDFLDYWDEGLISERSSLTTNGTDEAIGCFGAYSAIRINFTALGLSDSCKCSRVPPECPE